MLSRHEGVRRLAILAALCAGGATLVFLVNDEMHSYRPSPFAAFAMIAVFAAMAAGGAFAITHFLAWVLNGFAKR